MTKTMSPNRSIFIDTPAGRISADLETVEDTGHASIYITFQPAGSDDIIDLAAARSNPENRDIQLCLFADPSSEDPTTDIIMTRESVETALTYTETETE